MELPKDVLGIVYRYVFDDKYKRLKSEYACKWLNNSSIHGFHWNDTENIFARYEIYPIYISDLGEYPVANWRNLGIFLRVRSIQNFRGHPSRALLPQRY